MQKYSERITGNKLALPKFIWADPLNKYIPLLKSPKVKLILNNCISKLAEPSKCAEFDRAGVQKRKKKLTSNIDFFVHFLTIGRNLSKKAMCPKKGGGHRPI